MGCIRNRTRVPSVLMNQPYTHIHSRGFYNQVCNLVSLWATMLWQIQTDIVRYFRAMFQIYTKFEKWVESTDIVASSIYTIETLVQVPCMWFTSINLTDYNLTSSWFQVLYLSIFKYQRLKMNSTLGSCMGRVPIITLLLCSLGNWSIELNRNFPFFFLVRV